MIRLASLSLAAAFCVAAASPSAETAIETAGPSGSLGAAMTGPGTADAPVVLLIPGSGPTDRDGNSPLGIRASSYRLLAEGLAQRGITTVRTDKRGMFSSQSAAADANAITIADYVEDVGAWVAQVRERTGAACLWLLGHSEGGLVALAARDTPGICGLVLVAAPGRPLGTVLREQIEANPANAPLLDQGRQAIAELEAGRRVETGAMHPALAGLFAAPIQGFLISLFSYDPAKLAAQVRVPMLIVQGGRDIQIGEADARRLAEANPAARLELLPEMNHVLKPVAGDDRAANVVAYADPSLPLAPGLVEAVAAFVHRR